MRSSNELVIIYDTPSRSYSYWSRVHNLDYFLKFFSRIQILYWAIEEDGSEIFTKNKGRFIFYPYCQPYSSSYVAGLKYMIWIGRRLWQICQQTPKKTQLILMTVIPIWAGLPALIIAKMQKRKIVLRPEAHKMEFMKMEGELAGTFQVLSMIKISILKLVYRLTIPFYDAVIGISQGMVEEARYYRAKKIFKIPIPIGINDFLAIKRHKVPIKFPNNLTILYVGQIKAIKGIYNLIKACRLLQKENLTPKALIVGEVTNLKDESYYRELKKATKGLKIEFLGWVPHQKLSGIYKRADIFILPSYSEALPMAVMEAMASGLPVIASKTSGAKELVKDGDNGFLVPVGDPKALKERIKILLEKADLRESMGERGRERIKELMRDIDTKFGRLWRELGLFHSRRA